MPTRPREIALAVALVVITAACTGGQGTGSRHDASTPAREAARSFLDASVEPDGRVSRHDQGNDTVSEGQSYALLLSLVAGDQATFDRVWRWTKDHLQRDDGLLSAHARPDGTVDDQQAATDADLVTAWALLRSGEQHHDDGRRIADAILDHEVVRLRNGRSVLAAGPWATGSPATINVSYWALPALRDIASRTGDNRWRSLADDAVSVVDALTAGGDRLPPDWARVDGDDVSATPAPNGNVPDVRYSFDAQRTVAWFAATDGHARELAAAWSRKLDDQRCRAIALTPDGEVLDGWTHAVALVAGAAAAAAAGNSTLRDARLELAATQERDHPTYYGSAWIAIGRTLLTTDLLRT